MSRGRGGMSTTLSHRGGAVNRGRGKSSAQGAPSKSKVPSFPVLYRSNASKNADSDDDAPPVAVSARQAVNPAQLETPNDSRVKGNMSTSGPRGSFRGRGRGNGEGFSRGSGNGATVTRGRGGGRGGFQDGRGRGRGQQKFTPRGNDHHRPGRAQEIENDSDEDEMEVDGKEGPKTAPSMRKYEPTSVVTTTTENGTEIPKKLNSKVFIDNLPYDYKPEPHQPSLEEEIFNFITTWKVGKPLRFIKKPGQGFGFILFKSPNSVPLAIRVLNGRKFLGRPLRVEEPKPKDMGTSEPKEVSVRDQGKDSYARQVLLTDLAKVAEPDIIREVLRDVAPQMEGKLETIKMTSNNRKAFLTFASPEDVEPAVNFLNGFHLLGRKVSASPAAAPGSLPYSRVPVRTNTAETTTAPGKDRSHQPVPTANDNEDEDLLIPLGMETSSNTKGKNSGKPEKATVESATPKKVSKGSNVTGKTEKYNLLDNGPREIYVGNLDESITVQQLRQHFNHCGKIVSCELIVNPNTHLLTGVAKIVFSLPAYAAYAKEHCHGSRLRGSVLHVDRGGESSAPVTTDLPPAEEEDGYDEDEYMRRHGIKDKTEYFKGTTVGKQMGISAESDDEESEDGDNDTEDFVTVSKDDGKKRKRNDKKKSKEQKRAKADDEDEDKFDLFVSDEDDSEDEHFKDVDEDEDVVVGKGKKSKGGKKENKKEEKIFKTVKNSKKAPVQKGNKGKAPRSGKMKK